ncbi:undecaprenyl-phosphate glucose phosphotransferase [Aestuariivirga sp.]|uniref:undecaprenyl-phosphate glucose phosphotransferase n=1 Tax=Aestuariivirga sp. TaxID=2650926 RepID=UPI0039E66C60
MATRTIDQEVVQRLAKGSDLAVLTGIALFLTLQASHTSQQVSAAGFFALCIGLASLRLVRGFGLYRVNAWINGVTSALKSFSVTLVIGLSALYAAPLFGLVLKNDWAVGFIVLTAAYFSLSRLFTHLWSEPLAKAGKLRQRIAIVGGGKAAEEAIHLIELSPELDAEVVGLFDDRFDNRSPESIRKHRKLGKIADLADYARSHAVDLVIVAIPMSAEQRLLQILKRLWVLPVDIRISAATAELKLSPRAYSYLGKLPLLNVFERPLSGWDSFLKGVVDKGIALAALLCLSPVMAVVALAVKLESKGPVIFRQKRFGFNNELVEVFKFRSMYTDMSDAQAAKLVTKDDPRVTRVGRIIRKTSLDELPQLFNVLAGTLSLVGPRPHATQAKAAGTLYDQVVDGYFARHKVKPGITGWAQVNGWRGETDTREKLEQRVKHDLEYIDRWSLGFDLYILAKTPLALLRTESAY